MVDYDHMKRALTLASLARGDTSPNPMVGCVLVRDGQIIGEGKTQPAGFDHAEIQALKDCRSRGLDPEGATSYTTLEPCNHTGRTGPCTEALIQAKVRRVVIAMIDPNPKVQGSGVNRLRSAGIEVEVGVLSEEAQRLNEAFVCYITKKRPFSLLKVAQTLDGKIADHQKKSQWITGAEARKRVHELRAESDAIITGVGTILADNPSLTVREASKNVGKDGPIRVIVDSHLRTPTDAKILHDDGPRTIIATTKDPSASFGRAEVWQLPTQNNRVDLKALYQRLAKEEIMQVMVEAGGQLNGAMVDAGLFDKLCLFVAPKLLASGAALSSFDAAPRALSAAMQLRFDSFERLGEDLLCVAYPQARG
jgi:diaminohydroxyphosphoribosylaminopyrimidine deaminase/5-amino-6-(5-phosphoribosylamino)uracil reductase